MKVFPHSITLSFLFSLLMASLSADADSPVYTSVSVGYQHTCALTNIGTVKCWGDNGAGQLGNGTTIQSYSVAVSELNGATAITAGHSHTCALTNYGTVKCWGGNGLGQLGDGTFDDANTPLEVAGLSGVTAISAGYFHTCALMDTGTVKCWGSNSLGNLGNGANGHSNTPVDVAGLSGVAAINAGYFHTCALMDTGTVKCWGSNYDGQLGDGTSTNSNIPVNVSALSGVTAISAGVIHTCAVMNTDSVKCWGDNTWGQLGDGGHYNANEPVEVAGLTDVTAISSGRASTCALTNTASVKCWGLARGLELGNASVDYVSFSPVVVSGLSDVTAISAGCGGGHRCALTNYGTVKCWGRNDLGQLGNVTLGTSSLPVEIIGENVFVKTFYAQPSLGGWILESSENSSKGRWPNRWRNVTFGMRLRVGDSATDRQYRSILHFKTSSLPDTAVITKGVLRIRGTSEQGDTSGLGSLLVSIRSGYYGESSALEASDFESPSSVSSVAALSLQHDLFSYSDFINSEGLSSISPTSSTQFRLRFSKGDNDDLNADYFRFYAGDSEGDPDGPPTLIVKYYVP